MKNLTILNIVAAALVIIGALNWGLVALAELDLVATIFGKDFGETTALSRVVYGLVGVAGVHLAAQSRSLFLTEPRAERVNA